MKRPRIEEIRKDALFEQNGNPAFLNRVAYLCDYAMWLEKQVPAPPSTEAAYEVKELPHEYGEPY